MRSEQWGSFTTDLHPGDRSYVHYAWGRHHRPPRRRGGSYLPMSETGRLVRPPAGTWTSGTYDVTVTGLAGEPVVVPNARFAEPAFDPVTLRTFAWIAGPTTTC